MKEPARASRKLKKHILPNDGGRTANPPETNAGGHCIWLVARILFLALFAGCAYFNTFYNAKVYYKTGVAELNASSATGAGSIPSSAREALETAIEKAHNVIDNYPKSGFIDDALLVIGKSHFQLREYSVAESYLTQLLGEYPGSSKTDEALIWLARIHFNMGRYEAVEEDVAPVLAKSSPSRELVTEVYRLRAEIALLQSDTVSAIQALLAAVEMADDVARQAEFYFQLYTLASEETDYTAALEFLDQYARLTPIEEDRINARLLRVQLLQKMNDFESAYREIRNMVALTEFADIVPRLQLELGKIELSQGNTEEALRHFIDLFEEYGTLPEADEAAFFAGEIYLTELHDIAAAKEYYERVTSNSAYFTQAQVKLKQITAYNELEAQIQSLREQLSNEPDDRSETTASTVDEARILNELAYALYRIAEIQLYDIGIPDTALKIMAEIVSSFDETEVAAQAAYVLYSNTQNNPEQADFWRTLLIERYPDSPYGLLLSGKSATRNHELDSLVALVDQNVPRNPRQALNLYRQIQMRFATEQSFFAIAYLYDEYLNELDSAITAYDEYLLQYPSGTYSKVANERLDFLRQIKASLPVPTVGANAEDVSGGPDSTVVTDPQLPASVSDSLDEP